ncbi:MAG: DUF2442 domain-containing protein [Rikenellaceae bacterium]
MEVKDVRFDDNYIYLVDKSGRKYKQSLLWYSALRDATDQQRQNYTISMLGLHWRDLDEDVSFESFEYDDAEPTELQRFFLTHKEVNIAEFAKRVGINATLLRNYINGFKQPSKEREQEILRHIHKMGEDFMAVAF